MMDFVDFVKSYLLQCPQQEYDALSDFFGRIQKEIAMEDEDRYSKVWDDMQSEILEPESRDSMQEIVLEPEPEPRVNPEPSVNPEPRVLNPEPKTKEKANKKEPPLFKNRLLPKIQEEEVQSLLPQTAQIPAKIVVGKPPIRASSYSAVEIHGFFGLIDDGPAAAGRMLIVHVPKYVRGYFLDIKDGDDIHVCHVNGKLGRRLRVLATGRHKYYPPGRRVTTCTICVPEEQWADFK